MKERKAEKKDGIKLSQSDETFAPRLRSHSSGALLEERLIQPLTNEDDNFTIEEEDEEEPTFTKQRAKQQTLVKGSFLPSRKFAKDKLRALGIDDETR